MLDKFNRISLGHFPTRIEYLKNISKHFGGPPIYIKRDDCTGLATGGNKTRKLEFLMADAIKNKADLVITVGAIQSNHARQTAAACAFLGIKCLIILEQRLEDPPDSYMNSGNVFLDKMFGGEIMLCPKSEDINQYAKKIFNDKKNNIAKNPYFIPGGGSNSIGALGYVECMREIMEHDKNNSFTHIVHATGSAGTQSGILTGKKYFNSNVNIIGISVRNNKETQENKVFQLANETCNYLKCKIVNRNEVVVFDEYIGKGYGIPTEGMKEAVKLMAQKEAILLDPVYSGKGFAGLIDLMKKKYFKNSDKILFVHTGGSASLFAYEWAF